LHAYILFGNIVGIRSFKTRLLARESAKYKIPHMPRLSVLRVKHSGSRVTTYSFLGMCDTAVQLHSSKIGLVEIMKLHSTN